LREQWQEWLKGARTGAISNRNGQRFKPSALDGYERAWRNHVEAEFGHRRIGTVTHRELQKWVDKKGAAGAPKSTINNALDPLRNLFRRALKRGEVSTNPTLDLDLPARDEEEVKIVAPDEAAALIAALPVEERALWATALYAGLRRGELRSIRWKHIELPTHGIGKMSVLRSWSSAEEAGPKTRAGKRSVHIVPQLASHLREHRQRTGRAGDDLVFGRTASKPFEPTTVRSRALKAWKQADPPLEAVTLHQCRHTAASFLIHAGVNAKAIAEAMGHASVETTFNRYGHLMKGNEEEVGALLATYLKNQSRRNGIGMADT
jgi:integrase